MKKQYGYYNRSAFEFGVIEWDEADRGIVNGSHGPFPSFAKARTALIKDLRLMKSDIERAIKDATNLCMADIETL